ncbi:receptor-type tyrosine-protein phosphatase epsilon-like [Ruditapes philippinarum]|uniref:receptor-type tyrosine-protein phosphatase epsilon-like n=1 Tax=Ruditapes philippinarum TaxID=129788 RepID=UPI00295B8942|nr:receptor-type tyrosine-protein phosphatase epsilon-like [Ruditapes philippinarum]
MMEDLSILEGAPLNFTCPVIPGNPCDTQIVWTTADKDVGEQWLSKFLEISNISRKHDQKYTCTVNNTMLPTFGAEKHGRNSKSFHLNVEYLATITAFYVEGYEQHFNITANEADSLTFICQVESKPVSTTSIYVQTGQPLSVSESNYISYNIHSAMCQHTEAYVCSGRNEHNNNQVSNRTLFVFINCSPRIDPKYPVKESVAVSLNEPVLLSLSALAYPIPTDVSWQKHNGYVWTDVIVTNSITIRRSHLNYSLIIDSIQEENFGMYKLTIANEKGSYEQIFHINAAGIDPSAKSEKTNTMVIVIGSVSGIIGVAFIITILVWIFKKRRSKKEHKGIRIPPRISFKESLVRHTALEMEHLQEIDDAPFVLTEHTEYYNSIQKIEKIDKIKVSELYQYVIGRDEDDFAIEYQNIPTDLQKPYNFATKPCNLALNRYNGIFPYDHSRVKIPAIPDFFMNACYIDGFERQHAYIASLGPTEKTTNHFITFWQMVWYEKSDVIVMLTNLVEPSGMKCEQYWPEAGAKEIYGDICVNSKRLETFAEYTVREFEISKKQEKRCVIQLHFTAWPDKTVPEDVTSLIEFRQRVIQTPTDSSGPVIVHCSAGIGRTGTFIALDRLIREGQKTNEINVFECVQNMRQQRIKMVQTLEQYVYIYKALVTALTFDSEVIPLSSLHEFTEGTSNNEYSRLFQQLNQTVEAVKEDEQLAVRRNENQTKENRVGADIPGKMFRVYLRLRRKQNDSDYINAVFINSFTKPNNFIMAQSPLPLTVEDFVSMIYQDDCICVVSLDDRNESRMSVRQYVPEVKQKLTFGSFRVSSSLLQTERYFVLKKLTISYDDKPKSGAKIVYLYQYTQWLEEKRIPECTEDFVHFVSEVQRKAREHGRKKFHILVHCLMANERSGLFCALAIIFEKLKLEGQVNMMNTLRHLRTRRRTAILSMEQLRFCFEAASIFAGLERNK